jgi:hypothetical protein
LFNDQNANPLMVIPEKADAPKAMMPSGLAIFGGRMMAIYDAGLERERLATALADWQARGFVPPESARRFDRRLKRLARVVGISRDELLNEIKTDAEAIQAGDEN